LESDFKASSDDFLVQEVIHSHGHICIMLPKFHCELNVMELVWAFMKDIINKRVESFADA
ncbi:hypothetical protein HDU98_005815, partial [Podochytrium sp. JEL0797]